MAKFLRMYNDFGSVNIDHIVTTSTYERPNGSLGVIAHMVNGECIKLATDALELSTARFVQVQGYFLWCLYTGSEEPLSDPVIGLYLDDTDASCGPVGVLLYSGSVHLMSAYLAGANYEDALQLPDGILDSYGHTFPDVEAWLRHVAAFDTPEVAEEIHEHRGSSLEVGGRKTPEVKKGRK